jgi:hypothetical protein
MIQYDYEFFSSLAQDLVGDLASVMQQMYNTGYEHGKESGWVDDWEYASLYDLNSLGVLDGGEEEKEDEKA